MKEAGGALIVCWLTAVSAIGQGPCEVDSSHDGNGLYTYTFHRGELPAVWKLGTNDAISVRVYGIREIGDAPGWLHTVTEAGVITWRPSGAPMFLDDPVTFTVQSCLAETATYDDWLPPGVYIPGVITGGVYELPGRTNYLGGGYQNFVFTGPALPALSASYDGARLLLTWSKLAQECQLESREGLTPGQTWMPVTNAPVVAGTNFTVALPATNSLRVFRLSILNVR